MRNNYNVIQIDVNRQGNISDIIITTTSIIPGQRRAVDS